MTTERDVWTKAIPKLINRLGADQRNHVMLASRWGRAIHCMGQVQICL